MAGLFDSVYLSLYKGLGGFAGAVLAGDEHEAAQERALYGAQHPDNFTTIQARSLSPPTSPSAPAPSPPCLSGNDTITVRVTHDIDMITFVGNWFGNTITLTGEVNETVFGTTGCP